MRTVQIREKSNRSGKFTLAYSLGEKTEGLSHEAKPQDKETK